MLRPAIASDLEAVVDIGVAVETDPFPGDLAVAAHSSIDRRRSGIVEVSPVVLYPGFRALAWLAREEVEGADCSAEKVRMLAVVFRRT